MLCGALAGSAQQYVWEKLPKDVASECSVPSNTLRIPRVVHCSRASSGTVAFVLAPVSPFLLPLWRNDGEGVQRYVRVFAYKCVERVKRLMSSECCYIGMRFENETLRTLLRRCGTLPFRRSRVARSVTHLLCNQSHGTLNHPKENLRRTLHEHINKIYCCCT